MREVLRYRHYSLKTEQAYLHWIRFFVRWHGRDGEMQHPRNLGGAEVTQFLTMLANERHVSVSTHNQALSALLFLYREVLAIELPWLTEMQRPTRPRRIAAQLRIGMKPAYQRAPLNWGQSPNRCSRFGDLECLSPNWDLTPIQLQFSYVTCRVWDVGPRQFLGLSQYEAGVNGPNPGRYSSVELLFFG